MSRKCYFTGRTTRAGGSVTRRGKAKYLGGVGRKITGRVKRKFKPNIQRVRAVVDGRVVRVKVSAKAIRQGLVIKPPKRTWRPPEDVGEPVEAAAPVAVEVATPPGEPDEQAKD